MCQDYHITILVCLLFTALLWLPCAFYWALWVMSLALRCERGEISLKWWGSFYVFCVLVVIVFDGVSSVKCSGFGALIKYTKNIGSSPNPNKRDQKRERVRSHVALWTNAFTLFSWVCQTAAFHAIDMDFTSKRPLLYLNSANNWIMVYYGCY